MRRMYHLRRKIMMKNDNKSTRLRDAVDGLKDAIDGFGNII